jgi:hypothetical protein
MLEIAPVCAGWQVVIAARPDVINPVLLVRFGTESVVHIARWVTRLSVINPNLIVFKGVMLARVPRAHYMRAAAIQIDYLFV